MMDLQRDPPGDPNGATMAPIPWMQALGAFFESRSSLPSCVGGASCVTRHSASMKNNSKSALDIIDRGLALTDAAMDTNGPTSTADFLLLADIL